MEYVVVEIGECVEIGFGWYVVVGYVLCEMFV